MTGQSRPALASRLTHRWVCAYTAHLDPGQRDTRRAEIDCDLWEHQADAQRMGLGSLRLNVQMIRRLLAGIPADLSWRRGQREVTPALTAPASVPAAQPSRWVCRIRGHNYVTKRLPNPLDDGGTYCVCERCNRERLPPGGPPTHPMSGFAG